MASWSSPLLQTSFWFGLQVMPFVNWIAYAVMFIIVLIFAAAIFVHVRAQSVSEKWMRRLYKRAFVCLLSAGITGAFLYLFTWQGIPVLGMRIFWPIWLAAHLLWGYAIWSSARREIPVKQKLRVEREAYEKWLPKPRKK